MKFTIAIEDRAQQGTGHSRRLRHTGMVPAIIYGCDEVSRSISVQHRDLIKAMKHDSFQSSILSLESADGTESVFLRELQVHPFRPQILHVDFQRVAKDKKLHTKVPLHFLNEANCPGVKLESGTISHTLTELEISCFPQDLPEYLAVDLETLSSSHPIHVSDLQLPEGVQALSQLRGENLVIASINVAGGASKTEDTSDSNEQDS